MKWLYKIMRTVLVTVAVLAIAVPALCYIVFSLPAVHERARAEAERQLTELLGTRVAIGRLSVQPLSSLTLRDVEIDGDDRQPALRVGRLGAGIAFWRLVFTGRIVVTYVELIDADIRITRATDGAPLNISGIIERLKPKDRTKPPVEFELAVNTVVIRRSRASYDVLDAPAAVRDLGVVTFDPRHLAVTDLKADLRLPVVTRRAQSVMIRRLSFDGPGSTGIENLEATVVVTPDSLSLPRFDLALTGGTRLRLAPLTVRAGLDSLQAGAWRRVPLDVRLLEGSRVAVGGVEMPLEASARGTAGRFDWNLTLGTADALTLTARGSAAALDGEGDREVRLTTFDLKADVPAALDLAGRLPATLQPRLQPRLRQMLAALGRVGLRIDGSWLGRRADAHIDLTTALGDLQTTLRGAGSLFAGGTDADVEAEISTSLINLRPFGLDRLEEGSADGTASLTLRGRRLAGATADLDIDDARYAGYSYTLMDLEAAYNAATGEITADLGIDDPLAALRVAASATLPRGDAPGEADIDAHISRFMPGQLGLPGFNPADSLAVTAEIAANARGASVDDVVGSLAIEGLQLAASQGRRLDLSRIDLSVEPEEEGARRLALDSDIATAEATFDGRVADLAPTLVSLVQSVTGLEPYSPTAGEPVRLTLQATIEPDNPIAGFVTLPVGLLSPVTVDAMVDGPLASLNIDAPYLRQGDKLIEKTALSLKADAADASYTLAARTAFPAKGGVVTLDIAARGDDGANRLDLTWAGENAVNRGHFAAEARVERPLLEGGGHTWRALVDVLPGEVVFADTPWAVEPARILAAPGLVEVQAPLSIARGAQRVTISGAAQADQPDRAVQVELRGIELDYVFETLNIEVAMFGGVADGLVTARGLLSPEPDIHTERLAVKALSYNGCVMGDADLSSSFDPATTAVAIGALIHQYDGRLSTVDGKITPKGELLDFTFTCDRAPVGFLRPFMAAFCNGIRGFASGQAHLFGTFSDVDMTGLVVAEALEMDIDITGTTYHTAVDTVRMSPGRIDFADVRLYDRDNHTAMLSGWLAHRYFHDPTFRFTVDRAEGLLCYDKQQSVEHPWYGRVCADGSVVIDGGPGMVSITANVAAVAGTEFTFVLDDTQQASEYNFLIFRDKTPVAAVDATVDYVADPEEQRRRLVEALRRNAAKHSQPGEPTQYEMTFGIDVTPAASLVLIMDPVGGDRIRCNGDGNLRLSYDSRSEDLRMYGVYTLDKGTYNFTLQDIFVKDFTIEEGSSISFHGDPYSAQLNLRAHYAVTANLTDLDESFAQDRDLNRTNVPVHALLLVTGDMRSPDLTFDLEFPTLQSDVYRKVRSIVSTDDMMNRQILYLLALNRFYTPEYMEATRGNELVSIASSTISSRLGSMLGQISDKVDIAPTIRSDRGDFSDVEVDLALSSHLLNNRLLLNGTFGYRDPSLNNTSFIGDFDIEYLLNRAGSLRLKAYNRYNDQNYYLKSALTTQGVGVVWKRDFDNIFPLFRRRKEPEPGQTK